MQLRFIADVALHECLFFVDDARQGREVTAAEQTVDLSAGRQSFVRRRLKRCGRRTATARDAGETARRVVPPDGGEQAETCEHNREHETESSADGGACHIRNIGQSPAAR